MYETENDIDPEVKRLAAAVILQAVVDFKARNMPTSKWIKTRWILQQRQDAAYFLLAEKGPWAESREVWCKIAGRSAVKLREWALETLKGEKQDDLTRLQGESGKPAEV